MATRRGVNYFLAQVSTANLGLKITRCRNCLAIAASQVIRPQASHDVRTQRTEVTCGLRRILFNFFFFCDFMWMVRLLVGPSILCWRCTPRHTPCVFKEQFSQEFVCGRNTVKSQQCTLGAVRCAAYLSIPMHVLPVCKHRV